MTAAHRRGAGLRARMRARPRTTSRPTSRSRPSSSRPGNRLQLLSACRSPPCSKSIFRPRGPGYLDLARADEALRNAAKLWLADNIDALRRTTRPAAAAHRSTRACRCRPTGRSPRTRRRCAHVAGPPLAGQPRSLLEPAAARRAVRISDPAPSAPSSRSDPRLERLGLRVATALRFLPPGGAVRAFEFHGDPGPGAARSALAPGRAALRRIWASCTSSRAPTTCCSCSAW